MTWKVAHACVRGSSHVRSGLPNQDAAQSSVTPADATGRGFAVVAVSDGHGGARHFRSQIGSSLAVSTAVSLVNQFLSHFSGEDSAARLTMDDVQALQRSLVDAWIAAVAADLANNPLTAKELSTLDSEGAEVRASVEESPVLAYGSTLLVAAATDSMVLYLQLGDGEILSVAASGETKRPLPGDERLVANQTTSLCQPEAWREFRSTWAAAPQLPALVLLSTDGYANSFRSDEDFLKIGADYLEILREQGISTLSEELPEILKEATQQGSGDDITLAILQGDLRKGAADPDPANPVKPKISSESRSALIEHLKARHSSQHRRIDELSSRLEQTRNVNRRLQIWILLLVVLGAGICVYTLRDRIFPTQVASDGGNKPELTKKKAGPAASGGRQSNDSADAHPTSWVLKLKNRDPITLDIRLLSAKEIIGSKKKEDYAQVAIEGDQVVLINLSSDTWTWWKAEDARKPHNVENGGEIELNGETKDVKFRDGVSGTIKPRFESGESSKHGAAAESGR